MFVQLLDRIRLCRLISCVIKIAHRFTIYQCLCGNDCGCVHRVFLCVNVIRAKWTYKPGSVESDYLSRESVTRFLKRATRMQIGPIYYIPIRVCSKWGLPSHDIATVLVVSYTTVSAFLLHRHAMWWESSFLRRYPSGYPAWSLTSILPCGARTFLIS